MKKITIKLTALGLTAALAAFVGLRIYGFYQNETKDALAKAAQAENAIALWGQEIQIKKAKETCNGEWFEYRLAQWQGRDAKRPTCGEHDIRIEMIPTDRMTAYLMRDAITMQLEAMQAERKREREQVMEQVAQAKRVHQIAEGWRAYAFNRKAQTKHLTHHIWNGLTGVKDPLDDVRTKLDGYQTTEPETTMQ